MRGCSSTTGDFARDDGVDGLEIGGRGRVVKVGGVRSQALEQISWLDQLGLDLIWFTEHHFVDDGYLPAWIPVATAAAAVTKRVRFSSDICLLPFFNPVRLAEDLKGAYEDWTQLIFGDLEQLPDKDVPLFHSLRNNSRLGSMADAKAIVAIVEGTTRLEAGSVVSAQLLV